MNFRCIPVYSDLRGYFSTVNVYMIVNKIFIYIYGEDFPIEDFFLGTDE